MARAFGIYLHIPFCAHRCDYCDFATWTDRAHLMQDYVDACRRDLTRRNLPEATTVFFGGGTPSLLPAALLTELLDAVPSVAGAEVTVECNPDTVSYDTFTEYVAHGVNRISLGVQSMVPHTLAALGRTHDPENVRRAVEDARRAGIAQINVDIIYGADGESSNDWQTTLHETLALEPNHVSAYALTVEAGTPLDMRIRQGDRTAPDDDDQATKYQMTVDVLGEAGFVHYEISNWAQPGGECRHNQWYWTHGDYLGIGCAAHSHASGVRWWTVRTPDRYITAIREGRSAAAGFERLSADSLAEEAFTLALRTIDGARYVTNERVDSELDALVRAGLCERVMSVDGPLIALTDAGAVVANDITARLLNAGAALPLAPTGPLPEWAALDLETGAASQ
ncbi:MAG: radical SAM family heme chaperone HemW [Acidimicrobiia bacterium]